MIVHLIKYDRFGNEILSLYVSDFAFLNTWLNKQCQIMFDAHNEHTFSIKLVFRNASGRIAFVSTLKNWEDFSELGRHAARYISGSYERAMFMSTTCRHCQTECPDFALYDRDTHYCCACGNYWREEIEAERERAERRKKDVNFKSYLANYHTRVRLDAKTRRSRKPLLGFELEVSRTDDQIITHEDAQEIIHTMDDLEMLSKYDGSVEAEFVSKPLVLSEAIEKACTCADYLRSKGFCSWNKNCCGFHIHFNRKAVKSDVGLMTFFVTRKNVLQAISGRTDDHYCSFDPHIVKVKNFEQHSDRYSAINFINRATIEFRAWRGTLLKERLICYLRLTDFLGRWSDRLSFLSWTEISWLVNDPFLSNLLKEKNEIDAELEAFLNSKFKRVQTTAGRWKAFKHTLKQYNCNNMFEVQQVLTGIQHRMLIK